MSIYETIPVGSVCKIDFLMRVLYDISVPVPILVTESGMSYLDEKPSKLLSRVMVEGNIRLVDWCANQHREWEPEELMALRLTALGKGIFRPEL